MQASESGDGASNAISPFSMRSPRTPRARRLSCNLTEPRHLNLALEPNTQGSAIGNTRPKQTEENPRGSAQIQRISGVEGRGGKSRIMSSLIEIRMLQFARKRHRSLDFFSALVAACGQHKRGGAIRKGGMFWERRKEHRGNTARKEGKNHERTDSPTYFGFEFYKEFRS